MIRPPDRTETPRRSGTLCYICPMGTADGVEPGAVDRAALQLIAEGVTELAGFELAAISIVHDGRLHTIAIAGAEHAEPELSTLNPPVAAVLAELENAEDWGMLKFVPHERGSRAWPTSPSSPTSQPLEAPDAWHPRDLLVALLEDDAGELRGVLSVDIPRNGLRPDAEQRRVIEQHARQAGRAVITLLERHEFEYGMRRERATSDYRGQLIDALSHQLQNPVAAITGNLELLFDDLEPGDPSERPLRAHRARHRPDPGDDPGPAGAREGQQPGPAAARGRGRPRRPGPRRR